MNVERKTGRIDKFADLYALWTLFKIALYPLGFVLMVWAGVSGRF